MLSIEAIIQLNAHFTLLHQTELAGSLHSITMTDPSSSSTDTSGTIGSPQGHLWDEPKPSESSTPQPVAKAQSDGDTADTEDTPEKEEQRKKYFDKFAKRFFKVDGVDEVFKKDDEARTLSPLSDTHAYLT
jgi:hypothetical protein